MHPASARRRLLDARQARKLGLLAGVVCAAALQIAGFHTLRHDDAFISYRYGQNLSSGKGFAFNPGERLMGSTSPAHCLVAGAVYRIAGKEWTPSAMSAIGCLGWLAQGILVGLLLSRALPRTGALFVGAAVVCGAAWSHRYVALETNLVAALVLGALWTGAERHWNVCALLCALAGLMRPDAYLVAVPLGLLCLRDLGSGAWRPAAIGAVTTLPWYLFAQLYFGSILPQSAASKFQSAALFDYLRRLVNYTGYNLFARSVQVVLPGLAPLPPAIAAWAVAGWGAIRVVRADGRLWPVPATLGMYTAAYLVLRASAGLEWHLYPVQLLLAVLALGGACHWAARIQQGWLRRGAAALGLLLLLFWSARSWRYASVHERAFYYGARHAVYLQLADRIDRAARPGDWIVVSEPGTLGYYTELPVVDLGGLITRFPKQAFREPSTRPHRLVSVDSYGEKFEGTPVLIAHSPTVAGEEIRLPGQRSFSARLFDRTRREDATEIR